MNIVGVIFGAFFLAVGVKFIYDARPLTKSLFSFGDKNEATLGFKLFGILSVIIGALLFLFNI